MSLAVSKTGMWQMVVLGFLGCAEPSASTAQGNDSEVDDHGHTDGGDSDEHVSAERCDTSVGFRGRLDFEFPVVRVVSIADCRYLVLETDYQIISRAHILSQAGVVERTLGFDMYLRSVYAADEDTLVFSGAEETPDGSAVGVVLSTDMDGNPKWEYRDNDLMLVTAVGPYGPDTLAATGSAVTWPDTNGSEKIVILEQDGAPAFETTVPSMFEGWSDGYSSHSPLSSKTIIPRADGQIVICGSGVASGSDFGGNPLAPRSAGFVAGFDDDSGWSWQWCPLWDGQSSTVGNCHLTPTGDALMVTATFDTLDGEAPDIVVAELAEGGGLLNVNHYTLPRQRALVRNSVALDDGSIVITGEVDDDADVVPMLVKIGANGERLWDRVFEFHGSGIDIALSHDGGLIVAGETDGGQAGFLVGVNEVGRLDD